MALYLLRKATPGSSEEHGEPVLVEIPLHRFIEGLVPRNASVDPTNDITFGTGRCSDSTRGAVIVAAAERTKQANATWAAGDGAGMHPGGSCTAWGAGSFHFFALGKSEDPLAYDNGMDSDPAAANLMANAAVVAGGWDLFRRVGGLLTVAAAWPTFTGLDINGGGLEIVLNGSTGATVKDWVGVDDSAQTETLPGVPVGVVFEVTLSRVFNDSSAGASSFLRYSALSQADVATSISNAQFGLQNNGGTSDRQGAQITVMTDALSRVRYRALDSTADHTLAGNTESYIDFRVN